MTRFSRSIVNLDIAPGERRSADRTIEDEPFRILVIGDFLGRGNRSLRDPLAGRRPLAFDRDSVDDAIAAIAPELHLPGVRVPFAALDDFHPDSLYQRLSVFQELAEMRSLPVTPPALPPRPSGSLLDDIVETGAAEPPGLPAAGDLAEFIRKVVTPHLVAKPDPRAREQAARADEAAGAAMRGILHHRDFQSLEAAWRGVDLLARSLETGGNLRLYLFDATLTELVSDLAGTGRVFSNEERPWTLIVFCYSFGQSALEVKVLARLGAMTRAAGAVLLGEALPPAEPSPEWSELRRSEVAPSIGLCLPRFLLRLPYGPNTSPLERLAFDEMPESVHEAYLWGNPAICAALLLAQSFTGDGWSLVPGKRRRIDGMPLHVYREEGLPAVKPCAEVLMTDKDAGLLLEQGFMPLASMKEQDSVLLVRFQSIADPVRALAGRWA
jgi:type VI secretion system protein ImpC